MAAAALACEAVAGLFGEEERHERVFNLLTRALAEIDRGFAGPARSAPLVLGVLMKLLHEAGYLPVLDQCAHCGSGGLALGLLGVARRSRVRVLGRRGRAGQPEAVAAMRSSVELPLAELRRRPAPPGAEEALRHIHQLYMHETGSRLRALRFAYQT